MNVDRKTLEHLAETLEADANRGMNLNTMTMRNIASIIKDAIGAPVMWPSFVAGTHAADEAYPGNPSLRLAFNSGVKWAVERYDPTEKIVPR